MTNLEIFRKAILKAENNGYPKKHNLVLKDEEFGKMYVDNNYVYFSTIFDHKFAKAFWGEEDEPEREELYSDKKLYHWQYHLQQMVLEKNPLEYLQKFL